MKYLVIDASLSGTGIRDQHEGGYIYPEDLDLSFPLRQKLKEWLSKYQNEHYNGFINGNLINKLDQEGKDIAREIYCDELVNSFIVAPLTIVEEKVCWNWQSFKNEKLWHWLQTSASNEPAMGLEVDDHSDAIENGFSPSGYSYYQVYRQGQFIG